MRLACPSLEKSPHRGTEKERPPAGRSVSLEGADDLGSIATRDDTLHRADAPVADELFAIRRYDDLRTLPSGIQRTEVIEKQSGLAGRPVLTVRTGPFKSISPAGPDMTPADAGKPEKRTPHSIGFLDPERERTERFAAKRGLRPRVRAVRGARSDRGRYRVRWDRRAARPAGPAAQFPTYPQAQQQQKIFDPALRAPKPAIPIVADGKNS